MLIILYEKYIYLKIIAYMSEKIGNINQECWLTKS